MKHIIYISICLIAWVQTDAQNCSFSHNPNPICDEAVVLSVINPQNSSNYTWDTDGDGNISKQEFLDGIEKWMFAKANLDV